MNFLQKALHPLALKILGGEGNGRQPNVIYPTEFQKDAKGIYAHYLQSQISGGEPPAIQTRLLWRLYNEMAMIRATVRIISSMATSSGWFLSPRPGVQAPNKAEREKVMDLLEDPNPDWIFEELLFEMVRDKYVGGQSFWETVRNQAGEVKEIHMADNSNMTIVVDKHGKIEEFVSLAGGSEVRFTPEEIMFFRLESRIKTRVGMHGRSVYGMSPIESLLLPTETDLWAQIHNRGFLKRGGKPRGMFVFKNADPEEMERNRAMLKEVNSPEHANEDLVVEGEDVDYKVISSTPKDMEFMDLRRFVRDEILAVFQVPPMLVSIIESGNLGGGTGKTQIEHFVENVIGPLNNKDAKKITRDLLVNRLNVKDWVFKFRRPDIVTAIDQMTIDTGYISSGVLQPDEVRRMRVFPSAEFSDVQGDEAEKRVGNPPAISRRQALAGTPKIVLDIENRFIKELAELFRKFQRDALMALSERGTKMLRQAAIREHDVERRYVASKGIEPYLFRIERVPMAFKQEPDIEAVAAAIVEEDLAAVIQSNLDRLTDATVRISAQKVGQKLDRLPTAFRENLLARVAELAKSIAEEQKALVRSEMLEGLRAGETTDQLSGRIREALNRPTKVQVKPTTDPEGEEIRVAAIRRDVSEDQAERIARTESARVFSDAARESYKELGVAQVQWIAAPDVVPFPGHVCSDNDRKEFSLQESAGLLPAHPNCRCTWAPVV